MKELKLKIELVPQSAWGNNLRTILTTKMWSEIRKRVLFKSDNACEICSSIKGLHCHEVWDYDDKMHIQKLEALQTLCRACHSVKHIGQTSTRGEKFYSIAVNHFMKINGVNRSAFLEHLKVEEEKFNERSRCEWQLDLDYLKNF